MPGPLLTFDGISAAQSGCGCFPPDSNGDVGPNHYVNAVNSSFRVFDKSGNPLSPTTTFNSFFSSLDWHTLLRTAGTTATHLYSMIKAADRWVISDFAFPRSSQGT